MPARVQKVGSDIYRRTLSPLLAEMAEDIAPEPLLAEADDFRPDSLAMYCTRCGHTAGAGSVTPRGCARCVGTRPGWDRVTRLAAYEAPMDGWIKRMKFAGEFNWAERFGGLLAEAVRLTGPIGRTVIVPVPMPWRRRVWRGYDQADLMAHALAKRIGAPCLPLLKRTRHTPPQTTVAPSRRPANIRGSFALRRVDLTGTEVVLVDDVLTTGATLQACVRCLKGGGARTVQVAVAAVAGEHVW